MRFIQLFLLCFKAPIYTHARALHHLLATPKSLVALLLLCCVAIPASAQTLVNGGKVTGAIIVAGQQDSYSFYGNTDEHVLFNMTDVAAGSLTPQVTIYNPDGSYLTNSWGYTVASFWNLKLPQTGQYTVIVRDGSGGNANTGVYQLYFAKSTGANEHGELINGGVRSETVEVGDLDVFHFSGSADEHVLLNMSDVAAGSLTPQVTIYNPDGSYLTNSWGYTVASFWNLKLPQTGQYTVIVRDGTSGNVSTGEYQLYFAKSTGANEHGVLINGGVRSETVEVGDLDVFHFSGNTDEHVLLNMTDVAAGGLTPQVTIYNPDGSYLSNSWGYTVASFWNLKLPQTGQYTVIVRDGTSGNASTGEYQLYFAKSTGANEHGELINGGVRSETVEVGDLDVFHFSGNTDEHVLLNMTDVAAGSLTPQVTIYNPDGSYLSNSWGYTVASFWNLKLPQTGQYTVIVRDGTSGNASTGEYQLYFAKSTGANEHGELINGGVRSETVEVGDLDVFHFSGNTDEHVLLNMTDVAAGSLTPQITIYNPDGSYLSNSWGYTVASFWNLKLPQTGQYTVIVRDGTSGNASTGEYQLYFAKSTGANEHGVLSNSGNRTETIDTGDLDSFTFIGQIGGKASLKVTDLNGASFTPSVTLYAPDGTYLTHTWGYDVASIQNLNLTSDGTYTVIIRDGSSGNANTGDYLLEFNVPNAPPSNTKPAAVASAPASVYRGEAIVLDASTSYDPDAAPQALSFNWQLASAPDNSTLTDADLVDANQAIAEFTPDASGEYHFTLNIDDGVETDSAEVMVVVINHIPVANAGADINTTLGALITLNGSGSSDADGDLLNYQWQLVAAPEDSSLTSINNSDSVTPNFTPDVAGIYSIQLMVNDGEHNSLVDVVNVIVSAANVAPNLSAIATGNLLPGEVITLDASASNDPDNGPLPLTLSWSLNSKPANSSLNNADINNAGSNIANVVPDVPGVYEFTLSGSDGENNSLISLSLTIAEPYVNQAPNANAGDDQEIILEESVILDASTSSDADGPETLAFTWSFGAVAPGSSLNNADISNADASIASFTPDVAGSYVLNLLVFDGETSTTDTLLVTVKPKEREPLACDLNSDFHIDSVDITMIMARRNQPAIQPVDLADWNKDGVINVLDARGCTLQCSKPKCALQ